MPKAIPDIRKRGRPPVGSKGVLVKLPPEMLARLDEWIGERAEELTRPEAVRRLMNYALDDFGIVPLHHDLGEARPASEVLGKEAADALVRKDRKG